MKVIYEPKGRAKEYADLACNLFTGCTHACEYCFAPAIRRQDLKTWSSSPMPRKDVLKHLARDAKNLAGEERELLFCFMSDPYQTTLAAQKTRSALLICQEYGFKNVSILTKAGKRASKDFDILQRNGWKFGSTIVFINESMREIWEPGAPSIESRIEAIKRAHEMGIYTWVSVEPVIDPAEALRVFSELKGFVYKWKVGKLNHFPKFEKTVDWAAFIKDARVALKGQHVYWKNDLLKFEV